MRLVRLLLATAVAAAAGGCADDGGREASQADCATFRFPSGAWKEGLPADGQRLEERREAVDGLVRCEILAGRTEPQVRAVLGPPSGRDRESLIYTVGEERSRFAVDSEQLQILIADGRVSEVLLTQG